MIAPKIGGTPIKHRYRLTSIAINTDVCCVTVLGPVSPFKNELSIQLIFLSISSFSHIPAMELIEHLVSLNLLHLLLHMLSASLTAGHAHN